MNTSIYKTAFAALLSFTFMISNAWAERTLIMDNNQTVTLNQALDCDHAADITIDTSDPGIYESGSKQLQRVSDTIRAMLSYECPGISEINITGQIRGLDEITYLGNLSARNNWLVQAIPDAYVAHQNLQPARWQNNSRYTSEFPNEQLAITDLQLGMSIKEATKIVERTFDVEPEYDEHNGQMTMLTGGCPAGFDINRDTYKPKSEWKCLKAWFSDQRIPELERVELIQVIKTDTGTIQQLLTEKYGLPNQSTESPPGREVQLLWRTTDTTTGSRSPQTLSAVVSKAETDLIITKLTLFVQLINANRSISQTDLGLRL